MVIIDIDACMDATETNATVVGTYYPAVAPPRTIPLGERIKKTKSSSTSSSSSTIAATTIRSKKKKQAKSTTAIDAATTAKTIRGTSNSSGGSSSTDAGTKLLTPISTSAEVATTTTSSSIAPAMSTGTSRTKMVPSYLNNNNRNKDGASSGTVTALARYHNKIQSGGVSKTSSSSSTKPLINKKKKNTSKEAPQRHVLHTAQSNLSTIEEVSICSNDTESVYSHKSGGMSNVTLTKQPMTKLLEPIPGGSGHSSSTTSTKDEELIPTNSIMNRGTKSLLSTNQQRSCDDPTPNNTTTSTKTNWSSVLSRMQTKKGSATIPSITTNAVVSETTVPDLTTLLQQEQVQKQLYTKRRRSSTGACSNTTCSSVYITTTNSTSNSCAVSTTMSVSSLDNVDNIDLEGQSTSFSRFEANVMNSSNTSTKNTIDSTSSGTTTNTNTNDPQQQNRKSSLSSLSSLLSYGRNSQSCNSPSIPTQHHLDTYSCTSSTMTPKVRNNSIPSSSFTSKNILSTNSNIETAPDIVTESLPSSIPQHYHRFPVNVDDDDEFDFRDVEKSLFHNSKKDIDATNDSTTNSDFTAEVGNAEIIDPNRMRYGYMKTFTLSSLDPFKRHVQQPEPQTHVQSPWKKLRCILYLLLVLLISSIIILSTSVIKHDHDKTIDNSSNITTSTSTTLVDNSSIPVSAPTVAPAIPVHVSTTYAPLNTNVPSNSPIQVTAPTFITSTPTTAFPVVTPVLLETSTPTTHAPTGSGVTVTMLPSVQSMPPGNGSMNTNKTTESNGSVIHYTRRVPVMFLNCGGPTLNMITSRSTINSKGETVVKNLTRVWESDISHTDYLFGTSKIFSKGHVEICQNYISNENTTNGGTISIADDRNLDALYCSERYFIDEAGGGYEIPVITTTPGYYRVEMYFMESYHNRADDRIFNIVIEDFIQQMNYSIFKEAGGMNLKASVINTVYVADESISIYLDKVVGRPMVNAMAIYYLAQE